jgi:hypothetical protein
MHLSSSHLITAGIMLITAAAQIFLMVSMAKRNLRRTFPVFFAYNGYAAAAGIFLAISYLSQGQSSDGYFYFYWVINSILMVLEFGVMNEVFIHAVKPFTGLIDLAKLLFRWAAAFLLIAATMTAFSGAGSSFPRCIVALMNNLGTALRLMQCGLLLLFFLFERRLNLSWRSNSVCAALGLSTNAAVGLSSLYFRGHFPAFSTGFDVLELGTYLAVVVAWVVCFRLPQPERKTVEDAPTRLIFQRWNETLLSTPFAMQSNPAMAGAGSFFPNVERTVERVMARKMTQ